MLHLDHTHSLQFLCLVIAVHSAYALTFEDPALVAASSRHLHAAVKRSDTQRRADILQPVYGANLTYLDSTSENHDGLAFSSTVAFRSRKPLVVLEHSEHLFNDIRCASNIIVIRFDDLYSSISACRSWSDMVHGHLVVSQAGCVPEGSRAPFKIQSVTCSPVEPVITFDVEEVRWHDAFHAFHISFGQTIEPLVLYTNQGRLHGRRQESATPTSVDSLVSSLIPSDSNPSATSVSIDLSHEGDAEDWFPGLKAPGPELPIAIDCKDCLTKGSLELSQGEWELLNKDDFLKIDSFSEIFKLGFVRFNIKDFLAHVELQISPSIEGSSSFALFSLAVPGVTGFTLPGIGKAGLLLEPQLSLSWKLSGAIELTYGFQLEIPNLDIMIDFADPEASQVTGLDGIDLSDLPFQANITDIELAVEVTLQPRVTLGIEILGIATAVSGLFIDLPKTTVVLKQIATDTFDVNCELLANTTKSSDQEDLQDFFQNLTHISTGYEVGIGLDFHAGTNFDLGVFTVKNLEFTSSLPLLSTQLNQLAATQCLVFQPDATSGPAFAKATKALADAQSVVAAAASSSSAAAAAAAAAAASASSASASASAANPGKESAAHSAKVLALRSLVQKLWLYGAVFMGGLFLSL